MAGTSSSPRRDHFEVRERNHDIIGMLRGKEKAQGKFFLLPHVGNPPRRAKDLGTFRTDPVFDLSVRVLRTPKPFASATPRAFFELLPPAKHLRGFDSLTLFQNALAARLGQLFDLGRRQFDVGTITCGHSTSPRRPKDTNVHTGALGKLQGPAHPSAEAKFGLWVLPPLDEEREIHGAAVRVHEGLEALGAPSRVMKRIEPSNPRAGKRGMIAKRPPCVLLDPMPTCSVCINDLRRDILSRKNGRLARCRIRWPSGQLNALAPRPTFVQVPFVVDLGLKALDAVKRWDKITLGTALRRGFL